MDHYLADVARVEKLMLSDGSLLSLSQSEDTSGNDTLEGFEGVDEFDANMGGNDILRGIGGNDIYVLGYGTDHDRIEESFHNLEGDEDDIIRIRDRTIPSERVQLRRVLGSLVVELSDAVGAVNDSLTVVDHYTSEGAQIERIFFDGTLASWRITSSAYPDIETREDDYLEGFMGSDVFDAHLGGEDRLLGKGGDDTYWLGEDTGHDTIDEGHGNATGDDGDVIRIKAGIVERRVRRTRIFNDLLVELTGGPSGSNNSYTVLDHFVDESSHVESIVLEGTGNLPEGLKAVLDTNDTLETVGDDILDGFDDSDDVFNSTLGGDDTLQGRGGNDTYWLNRGTGSDIINESTGNMAGDDGDKIKIGSGYTISQVRVERSGANMAHLQVSLLDENNRVTDSFRVLKHFQKLNSQVEHIIFTDSEGGTISEYSAETLLLENPNTGDTGGNDILLGTSNANEFDAIAGGNDVLRGKSGNDIYWLGYSTGHDVIDELFENPTGDDGDVIRVREEILSSHVRAYKYDDRGLNVGDTGYVGDDLRVDLYDNNGIRTSSLSVSDQFSNSAGAVEGIYIENRYYTISDAISLFNEIPGSHSESMMSSSSPEEIPMMGGESS